MDSAGSVIPLASEIDRTVYRQIPGQGTLVPKARENTDGRSFAFDAERPSTRVVVDPGVEGGGFVVDYSTLAGLSGSHTQEVVAAAGSRDACVDFLRGASQLHRAAVPVPVQSVFVDAAAPLPVMAAGVAAEAIASLMDEVTNVTPPRAAVEQESGLSAVPDGSSLSEQETNSVQADLQAIYSLLRQQQQQIIAMRNQPKPAAVNPASIEALLAPPPARESAAFRPQPPAVVSESSSAADELVKSLDLFFITLNGPQPPTYQVVFDFPDMGTMSARYHAVVLGRQSLVLVYDTRFVNGYHFMPPTRRDESAIEVSVPKLGNKRYSCGSLGLEFTLGCLDVVVLLVLTGDDRGEERGN
jgi:hypothetical protein